MRKVESALLAAFDHRFRNAAHVTFNRGIGQLIFMIGHTPSAAGTEMPLAPQSDFFGDVQSHVNRRDQWLRVTEVRALVKVNPFEWEIVGPAELGGFEQLFAR